MPSLFIDIRTLYADVAKRQAVELLVEGYRDSLERTGTLQPDADLAADDEGTADAPSTYVWVLYYLAQHYSSLGAHVRALELIDAAITHTPSLADFHLIRARVLKRGGDRFGAERAMEAARALDGQDRFLNCKVAKYLLRCDRPEDAERIAGLFTRVRSLFFCWPSLVVVPNTAVQAEASSPLSDLIDMQALWFLQEQGEAFRRQGRTHLALKRFHQVEKV